MVLGRGNEAIVLRWVRNVVGCLLLLTEEACKETEYAKISSLGLSKYEGEETPLFHSPA